MNQYSFIILLLVILLLILLVISITSKSSIQKQFIKEGMSYPIDAVITYVDSSDPEWKSNLDVILPTVWNPEFNPPDAAVGNRFRSLDELKYCIRSIEQNAPWIRMIHLVVSSPSQLPQWLDQSNQKLRIITHDQIIPTAHLPTFNSHVIEAHLHRIPYLSEIFLYFNDDIFLNRTTSQSDFISSSGKPKFFPDGGKGKWSSPKGIINKNDSAHEAMWKNVNAWLDKNYKTESRSVMFHVPAVLSRTLMNKIWDDMWTELNETSQHQFRNYRDYGLTCALHQYISWYEGKGELVEPVLGIADNVEVIGNIERDKKILNSIKPGSLCFGINDSDPTLSSKTKDLIISFLETRFPNKSSFEL